MFSGNVCLLSPFEQVIQQMSTNVLNLASKGWVENDLWINQHLSAVQSKKLTPVKWQVGSFVPQESSSSPIPGKLWCIINFTNYRHFFPCWHPGYWTCRWTQPEKTPFRSVAQKNDTHSSELLFDLAWFEHILTIRSQYVLIIPNWCQRVGQLDPCMKTTCFIYHCIEPFPPSEPVWNCLSQVLIKKTLLEESPKGCYDVPSVA